MNFKKFLVAGLLATSLITNVTAQEATTAIYNKIVDALDSTFILCIHADQDTCITTLKGTSGNDFSLQTAYCACLGYISKNISQCSNLELAYIDNKLNYTKMTLEIESDQGTPEEVASFTKSLKILMGILENEITSRQQLTN